MSLPNSWAECSLLAGSPPWPDVGRPAPLFEVGLKLTVCEAEAHLACLVPRPGRCLLPPSILFLLATRSHLLLALGLNAKPSPSSPPSVLSTTPFFFPLTSLRCRLFHRETLQSLKVSWRGGGRVGPCCEGGDFPWSPVGGLLGPQECLDLNCGICACVPASGEEKPKNWEPRVETLLVGSVSGDCRSVSAGSPLLQAGAFSVGRPLPWEQSPSIQTPQGHYRGLRCSQGLEAQGDTSDVPAQGNKRF